MKNISADSEIIIHSPRAKFPGYGLVKGARGGPLLPRTRLRMRLMIDRVIRADEQKKALTNKFNWLWSTAKAGTCNTRVYVDWRVLNGNKLIHPI